MSLTSSHIRLFTSELLALECWKAHIWPCPIDSAINFDQIFIKLAGNQDSHKFSDELEFRPDQTFHLGVIFLPLRAKKAHNWLCLIDSDFIFHRMFFKFAGYNDSYKVLDKLDFGPDQTIFFGVTCPWANKIFSHSLVMETVLSRR